MTTQQRTYRLPSDPAEQDAWIAWWRGVSEPRAQFGFRIKSAVLDRENSTFTWMVEHDGDFKAAEIAYVESPERQVVFDRPKPDITVLSTAFVEVIV